MIMIRRFETKDRSAAIKIWNEIVSEGRAFPQTELLTEETGLSFFLEQTYTAVALETNTNQVVGLYILHPNNVGRCGHICNASYAVASSQRGKQIGETLVRHCLKEAPKHGFRILQFNAVVASNRPALKLYKKLGFLPLGIIPKGFQKNDGTYDDIIPHYIELENAERFLY